jgi:catechol 2,3-dioxygenase-like lactoylglutathione lyase family enzyme
MRLGHVGYTVSDLDRSERFYSELFGFKTFFRIRRKTPWLDAQVGYRNADIEFCHMRGLDGLHLELLKYWHPNTDIPLMDATYFPGSVHMNVWVDDASGFLARACDWMQTNQDATGMCKVPSIFNGLYSDGNEMVKASTITDGPQKGGKGFYMRDPDGHTIEIWQPPPGSKFGKEAVLSVELAQIIDRMEAARSENNTSWMNLVRLAYRTAPDEAAAIFRKIEAKDAEILNLAQSSAGKA